MPQNYAQKIEFEQMKNISNTCSHYAKQALRQRLAPAYMKPYIPPEYDSE
jgi:hypothetical protein